MSVSRCVRPVTLDILTTVVDWADLVTLDLSQFDLPGGKQRLAHQLRDAVHNVGFFYVSISSHLSIRTVIGAHSCTR